MLRRTTVSTSFGEAWNDEVRKWGNWGNLNERFSAFFLFFF